MNLIDYFFQKIDNLFYALDNLLISIIDNLISYFYLDGYNEYPIGENEIYTKYKDGYWSKSTYNENKKLINFNDSDGFWIKIKYSDNIQESYEDSTGFWSKITYNDGESEYTDSKGQNFIIKKEGNK